MTPEGRVKDEIKKLLKKYSVYTFMPVQTGYGAPSLDFLGCIGGVFFAIEAKAPGELPTERQKMTIEQMKSAGAEVFVIDGVTAPDYKKLQHFLDFYERSPRDNRAN